MDSDQGVVTDSQGRIVRNLAQGPDQDPDDGPRLVHTPEERTMTDKVKVKAPDGTTVEVSPKVAAILERQFRLKAVAASKRKAKAEAEPEAEAEAEG